MTDPTSLDVLEDVVRHEHGVQERRAVSVDGQAGLVLGFSGLLVSVGVDVVWSPLALAGRVLAAAAGLAALRAFSSRRHGGPGLIGLRRESRPPEELRWLVLDLYLEAQNRMEAETSGRVAYLRRAVRLLTLAVAVTGVGAMVETITTWTG